jgi:Fe-S cluster assembly iron-binding protein IscA
MLAVTQGAADVIRDMIEGEEEAAAEGGLRIDTGEASDEGVDLDLQFVDAPEEGDETVEEHGARVFLSAEASSLLDDKVLDAHEHGDHVHFSIEEQEAG